MKTIKISRFGKLIPEMQKENYGKDGFHNAPAPCGFYCFNQKFVEHFLVGDKIYKRDLYHAEIVDGYVWTHLEPPKRNYIAAQHNSWYKVRVQDYNKILRSVYNSEVFSFEHQVTYAKDHLELFCTYETIFKNIRKGFNKYKSRGMERSHELWDEMSDKARERYAYYRKFNENLKELKDGFCDI